MPKNPAEDLKANLPDDFAGAAEAAGVAVPVEAKAPQEPPKPEVTVAETPEPRQEQPRKAPLGKPGEGQDRVDFRTASPEEIEARFNRMYRQVKATDENQRVQGQVLEKILKDKQVLEAKLRDQEGKDAIQTVRERIKTARDNGNVDEEDRYRDQLVTLTTELEVAKRLPATPVAEAPMPQRQPASDPYGTLSPSDVAEITRWGDAEDTNGNLLRPWTKEGNRRTGLATTLLAQVLAQTASEPMTMAEKLALVDDQMGTQLPATRRTGSPVMGGNLTAQAQAGKPSITPKQAQVAERLFPHLSKKDAHRAYYDGGLGEG